VSEKQPETIPFLPSRVNGMVSGCFSLTPARTTVTGDGRADQRHAHQGSRARDVSPEFPGMRRTHRVATGEVVNWLVIGIFALDGVLLIFLILLLELQRRRDK